MGDTRERELRVFRELGALASERFSVANFMGELIWWGFLKRLRN